jgi:hypothetical protein
VTGFCERDECSGGLIGRELMSVPDGYQTFKEDFALCMWV